MPRKSFTLTGDGRSALRPVEPRRDGVCDNKLSLGARLHTLRERAGVSPKALAEALNISPAAVYNWESGRTRPDISNVPAICTRLGIGISELFVDDAPASDMTAEERALIRDYRALDDAGRAFFRNMLDGLLELREHSFPGPLRELVAIPFAEDALAAGLGDPLSGFDAKRHIYACATPAARRADWAFRVNGESMLPDYRDGDIVLVEKTQGPLGAGEVGAFSMENELYIKEYRPDGLYSRNPAYAPRLFKDYAAVHLIGRVTGILKEEERASAAEIRRFKEAAR